MVLIVLAGSIDRIIEAWWFGAESPAAVGRFAVSWISLLIVAGALYGVMRVLSFAAAGLKGSAAAAWIRSFLMFMAVLSYLVSLQLIILLESVGAPGPALIPDLFALMICSLVSFVWPAAFGFHVSLRTAGGIFAFSVATLGIALLILEPYALGALLVALGVTDPPRSTAVTERFLEAVPFLVPIGPILWATFFGQRSGTRVQK
jgi:hypothetical protein